MSDYTATFMASEGYSEGFWRGREITGMDTSHLLNVKGILQRFISKAGQQARFEDWNEYLHKLKEIQAEIDTRKGEVISKHEFRILPEDIIALAKAKGAKIPKSGAGVYVGSRENQTPVGDVFVRWDTTTKLKEKE